MAQTGLRGGGFGGSAPKVAGGCNPLFPFWGRGGLHPLEVSSGGEACKKDQQRQQALGLLAVMRQTCFLPGVISYSAVISACEKVQRWQQALGLWS